MIHSGLSANGEITCRPRDCPPFKNALISGQVYWLGGLFSFQKRSCCLPRVILLQHAQLLQGNMLLLTWFRKLSCKLVACFCLQFVANPGKYGFGHEGVAQQRGTKFVETNQPKNYPHLNANPSTENAAKWEGRGSSRQMLFTNTLRTPGNTGFGKG